MAHLDDDPASGSGSRKRPRAPQPPPSPSLPAPAHDVAEALLLEAQALIEGEDAEDVAKVSQS